MSRKKQTTEKEYGSVKFDGRSGYLPGAKAAIIVANSTNILAPTDATPQEVVIKDAPKKEMPKVVPWGEDNDFPKVLTEKVPKAPTMGANLLFNILASAGDGVEPVVMIPEGKEKVLIPLFNVELYLAELIENTNGEAAKKIYEGILTDIQDTKDKVDKFWEENDIDGYMLESFTDLHWFYNIWPELILNKDRSKIVQIKHKEAVFSRYSEMNDKGEIEFHYYYGKWGEKQPDNEENICYATPLLDFHSPVRDLRDRMSENKNSKQFSYVLPINFPTPGRNYYQKPYWYSLIESGWFDFAATIPELKKNIIQNQAIINYIIELDENYFEDIFKHENITEEKAKIARQKKEFDDWNKFLTDKSKTNQSIITYTKRNFKDGAAYPKMKINVIDNKIADGKYIEDSAEVSALMCYAMLVHPSMIGPQPGKNTNLSGSEAREQFLIKQAILRPIIKRALRPFYVIKAINGWSKHLHFIIPHIELTTLDENKKGIQTQLED